MRTTAILKFVPIGVPMAVAIGAGISEYACQFKLDPNVETLRMAPLAVGLERFVRALLPVPMKEKGDNIWTTSNTKKRKNGKLG